MIYGVTGHRPPKLGGYSDEAFYKLYAFAITRLLGPIRQCNRGDGGFIIGMAQGWDQAIAEMCQEAHTHYVAAIPFRGQEIRWPAKAQSRYQGLLHGAQVHYTGEARTHTFLETVQLMQRRNEYIVDNCDELIALWDGSSGSTANCIAYANKVGKPVTNLWIDWIAYLLE